MTGSIQEKNGKYYAVLSYYDTDGVRRQKWINTNLPLRGNKKRAEQVLREMLIEYDDNKLQNENISVADYFTEWLIDIKSDVSLNTYRGYVSNMNNHIIPYFRKKKILLKDLKTSDLDEYYKYKTQSGSMLDKHGTLSAMSIKHHHQNISKALSDAVRKELIEDNPAARAVKPKIQCYKANFLNTEQVNQLLLLCKDTTINIPIQLIAFYGLRRSEALGLCWKNVDFVNRKITISQALLQNTGGDYLRNATKNDSSYRTLPMPESMYDLLKSHKEKQTKLKKLMGNCYFESDFVCTWNNGKTISPNYLSKTFNQIITNSTLPKIRLHDLRHSTASNLLSNNFSVVEVQEWLGHASASTTLNFYAHIDSTSKNNMGKKLDCLLKIK